MPGISLELLQSLVSSIIPEDLSYCCLKQKEFQLRLIIDLHPEKAEKILQLVNDKYKEIRQNGTFFYFF